jgi:hypothetical protein
MHTQFIPRMHHATLFTSIDFISISSMCRDREDHGAGIFLTWPLTSQIPFSISLHRPYPMKTCPMWWCTQLGLKRSMRWKTLYCWFCISPRFVCYSVRNKFLFINQSIVPLHGMIVICDLGHSFIVFSFLHGCQSIIYQADMSVYFLFFRLVGTVPSLLICSRTAITNIILQLSMLYSSSFSKHIWCLSFADYKGNNRFESFHPNIFYHFICFVNVLCTHIRSAKKYVAHISWDWSHFESTWVVHFSMQWTHCYLRHLEGLLSRFTLRVSYI